MKNNHLWMNRDYGHLLTYDEMLEEARELYDCGDDTNACDLSEYYLDTGDEVPEGWNEEPGDIEPDDIDSDMGFDPYEGCFTWDC